MHKEKRYLCAHVSLFQIFTDNKPENLSTTICHELGALYHHFLTLCRVAHSLHTHTL